MKKKYWRRKGKGTRYEGKYVRDKKGERNFVLVAYDEPKNSENKRITFESWQMAKELGWRQ